MGRQAKIPFLFLFYCVTGKLTAISLPHSINFWKFVSGSIVSGSIWLRLLLVEKNTFEKPSSSKNCRILVGLTRKSFLKSVLLLWVWTTKKFFRRCSRIVGFHRKMFDMSCSIVQWLTAIWFALQQDTRQPPGYFAPSNIVKDAF